LELTIEKRSSPPIGYFFKKLL